MAGTTGLEPATSDVTGRRSRPDCSHAAMAARLLRIFSRDRAFKTASEGLRLNSGKSRSKPCFGQFEKCSSGVRNEFLSCDSHHLAVFFRPSTIAILIMFSCSLNYLGSHPVFQDNVDLNPVKLGHKRHPIADQNAVRRCDKRRRVSIRARNSCPFPCPPALSFDTAIQVL
jgi:hypothetical protein